MAGAAGYCAAKYGVSGLVKAMALDLRRANVAFSLLYLGGVDSPFWETIAMRVQRDKMLTTEDAARAVLYAVGQARPGVVGEIVLQPESHQLL
jgi:short-subunit dehydrogenase